MNQALTAMQLTGKERCWLVRMFGARPIVVSEFWITHVTAGLYAIGRIRSQGRGRNQSTRRQVNMSNLFATRKAAEKERDRITELTPLPDYTNPKIIFLPR